MKKFLSVMMAVVMLLCSTVAMADVTVTADVKSVDSVKNGTAETKIDSKVVVEYKDGKTTDTEAQAATEMWLQVDATGQIDVTLPLVLVFKTNIDGGSATSPTNYEFINYSSSDLVVTKIETKTVEYDPAKQPMKMVAYSTNSLAEDTYKAQLNTGTNVVVGTGSGAENGVYDLYTSSHTNNANKGGLFELKKAEASGKGVETPISVSMSTGKLSFVTSRSNDTSSDSTKGIQLLTLVYTISIDTSDAIGEVITTAATATKDGNILNGTDSAGSDSKIVPDTTSDAKTGDAGN